MNVIAKATAPIINIEGLAGVTRVEDASGDGRPAMKIVFADGVEATVTRAFIDKSKFDIWLPPDRAGMAASVMPNVDEERVMAALNKLAAKAAAAT
jgi:flavin-dependent dehydrogenase